MRATLNVLLATALLVIGLITTAFQIAGLIDIRAAHLVLVVAWIASVGGICTAEIVEKKSKKTVLLVGFVTAVISALCLYAVDSWMVKKKFEQEKIASQQEKTNSEKQNVAAEIQEKRKTGIWQPKVSGEPLYRTIPGPNGRTTARCSNPPTKPILNYWPVTYLDPAEVCHDFPFIDARLTNATEYAKSKEEWEAGVIANLGDEIYVTIYVNNGVANMGLDRAAVMAKNVVIVTQVDDETQQTHFILVSASGDNVATIYGRKRINISRAARLEPVQESGQIFDATGSQVLADDLNLGNASVQIGDLGPDFTDALFVRFKLKVVA
jgi:hypothetical protein